MLGGFQGGDPRKFHPDPEVCSPEEMKNHEEACAAWARGERPEFTTQVNGTHPDGVRFHASVRPFGIGYQDQEDEEEIPEEPTLPLEALADEELLSLYLSNAGPDSDEAMRILAGRHGTELTYTDEDPDAQEEDQELAQDH